MSEKEIEVELPIDLVESNLAHQEHVHFPRAASSLRLHRHLIALYHIHTRIRFTLNRLKGSHSRRSLDEKIALRFQQLDDWKIMALESYSDGSDCADAVPLTQNVEMTELQLEYHKARRSLLQPLLTEATSHFRSSPMHYTACADSSGQICQLYRRLHRLSALPFTLRDLHAVFVAGFTLIYSICAVPSLYDAHRANDIGACSTVLYVITEQWPSARKYRDAFEIVAERMVELTQQRMKLGTLQDQSTSARDEDFDRHQHMSHDSSQERWEDSAVNLVENGRYPLWAHNSGSASPSTAPSAEDPLMDDLAATGGFPGIRLDLAAECDEIGDLLADQGMNWFADFAFEC